MNLPLVRSLGHANSPPREEGWLRHQENFGVAHLSAADGVVAQTDNWFVSDHPGRSKAGACAAATMILFFIVSPALAQLPISKIVPDAEYAIPGNPDWLAMGEDMVWVNSKPTDYVFRMDPLTNRVVAQVPVKKPCSGLIIGAGTLWSPSCEENVIYRISVDTNEVVAKVPVGPANTEGGISFGAGSAWMPSDPKGIVSRIDPKTNSVTAQIRVAAGSFTAIYGFGLVWVSSTENNLVSVIDPAKNAVIKEIAVDPAPRFMAAGEGHIWTLNQKNGTVSKIDPQTKEVVATIDAGVPGTGGCRRGSGVGDSQNCSRHSHRSDRKPGHGEIRRPRR
jgi:YVTN family beta-propeller protein